METTMARRIFAELLTLPDDDDAILGGQGDDHLDGFAGRDLIYGLGGHDLILAQGADDTVFGGAGNDEIDGAGGNDLIYGGSGDDTVTDFDGRAHVYGGSGNDSLFGTDGALYGGAGNDYLDGEIVVGGGGQDLLFGGADPSDLRGGSDDDALVVWSLGNDTMAGGSGHDQFIFAFPNRGTDTITDFDATQDVLNLQDLGITQDGIANYAVQIGADTHVIVDKGASGVLTIVLIGVDATDLIL